MKKNITLSIFSFFSVILGFSQTQFQKDYEAVRTELVTWDAVRGEWLANSFEAMVNKQAVPERTFPEDLTPNELFHLVPKSTQKNVQAVVIQNQRGATEASQKDAWKKMAIYTETGLCKPVSARSYGDPHLTSFDGGSFSFQTVGEFVMTKSGSGHMEVQARQGAESDNFSLNTAIAMNVVGDRFCVYANKTPDSDNSTPFRLNGSPIRLDGKTYHLPHGGTIVKLGRNDYVVNWPTGERVVFDMKTTTNMNFIKMTVEILPCLEESFNGVLGNANRDLSDDFKTSTGRSPQGNFVSFVSFGNDDLNRTSQDVERSHLAFISQDFANEWRVNNENTLFDYAFGESTYNYTDLSFPRVHITMSDMPAEQRVAASRSCEEAGLTGAELRGCIYDRGFLNIPANPRPVVVDRGEGLILTKIDTPVDTKKELKNVNEKPLDLKTPTDVKSTVKGPVTEDKADTKAIKNTEEKPVKTTKEEKETTGGSSSGWFKSTSGSGSSNSNSGSSSTSTPVVKETKSSTPIIKETKSTSTPVKTSTPTTTPVITPVKKGRG